MNVKTPIILANKAKGLGNNIRPTTLESAPNSKTLGRSKTSKGVIRASSKTLVSQVNYNERVMRIIFH